MPKKAKVKLTVVKTQPKPLGRKRKSNSLTQVVSFRVTADRNKKVEELIERNSIYGVSSTSDFARKVLADYLAGRLVYKTPKHIKADFDRNPELLKVAASAA